LNNTGGGKSVFITTAMPLQWIYVGARFGWNAVNLNNPPTWKPYDNRHLYADYRAINGAVSGSIAFFPESVPFFSRFSFQAEVIFNYDIGALQTITLIPAALLKCQVYRQGNILFSVFGGAYMPFPLDKDETIAYSIKPPVGITAGVTFGGKFDPVPGLFFIDLRFSMDLFNTFVRADDEGYRRMSMTLSVGYEFGFITKK